VKTLYVLRHAKSDWGDDTVADHDRGLAPRGRRATHLVAARARHDGIRPEVVLCSSARRARQTLKGISGALGPGVRIVVEEDLYGAGAPQLLARLRLLPPGTGSAMVIGHNPGLHVLALELAGDGEPAAMAKLTAKFPTAALATLSLPASEWSAVASGTGYLEALVLPRELA
jgi:phosphohistidine phosphatase